MLYPIVGWYNPPGAQANGGDPIRDGVGTKNYDRVKKSAFVLFGRVWDP